MLAFLNDVKAQSFQPGRDGRHCIVYERTQGWFGNKCPFQVNILYSYRDKDDGWCGRNSSLSKRFPGILSGSDYDFGDFACQTSTTEKSNYGKASNYHSFGNTPVSSTSTVALKWFACTTTSENPPNTYGLSDGWWPVRYKRTGEWYCKKIAFKYKKNNAGYYELSGAELQR